MTIGTHVKFGMISAIVTVGGPSRRGSSSIIHEVIPLAGIMLRSKFYRVRSPTKLDLQVLILQAGYHGGSRLDSSRELSHGGR